MSAAARIHEIESRVNALHHGAIIQAQLRSLAMTRAQRVAALGIATAAMLLCACGGDDGADAKNTMRAARADAAQKVSDARQQARDQIEQVQQAEHRAHEEARAGNEDALRDQRVDSLQTRADARFNLAKAEAQAAYKVATTRCAALGGEDIVPCQERAKARYEAAVQAATTRRDAAHGEANAAANDGQHPAPPGS
ncbi:MAG TPA: hypothetical protein VFG73_08855 [Rhodanobacteraceae bacterium]|nr:hypothetical protein [Rhodanobacteraceae bacterium]